MVECNAMYYYFDWFLDDLSLNDFCARKARTQWFANVRKLVAATYAQF
jgi:hypothetical protein